MKRFYPLFICLLIFSCLSTATAQKVTVQEIVAKHLDSVGTASSRSSVKNQLIVGEAVVRYLSQKDFTSIGRVVMVSEDNKNFFGLNLNAADYPTERFTFDGSKASVGYIRTGIRSPLGSFILSNNSLIEASVFGGVLQTSWILNHLSNSASKLSYDGTKKIDGRENLVLSYSNTSGITIKIYLDKETYRHTRTEYRQTASAGIGTRPEQSSQFSETRVKLVEDFSDFKTVNNLTLPHLHRINYSVTGQRGTLEMEWTLKFTQFLFNQKLEEKTFDADGK